MSATITKAERLAIQLGISRFFPRARVIDGNLRPERWTDVTEIRFRAIPATQDLAEPHPDPSLVGWSRGTRPWETPWLEEVSAATHRADAMTALAQELNQYVLALNENDEIHAKTFDDLDTWLAKKAQSLSESIDAARRITLEHCENARDRWIEDLTDDDGGKWFRISDRALDALASMACSQGAAMRVVSTVPRALAHTFSAIIDPGRRNVTTYRGNSALTVPYIRVETPRGTPLMLPYGDEDDEQIKGTSIPLHRALAKPMDARTLLQLFQEWIERPRDEHGEKLDYFELVASRILERWGLSTKGSPRSDFTRSVERLAALRVDAASTGGRERWVNEGESTPLLTITKCEIDGREAPNKPRRVRLAPVVADALSDIKKAVQIRTESLRLEPQAVLAHLGIAGLIRDRITETFENMRATGEAFFRLETPEDFVRWGNRESKALHDGTPMQFRKLQELAREGYVTATIERDGSVVAHVDPLWLDVYRAFEDAKARHTKANRARLARRRSR